MVEGRGCKGCSAVVRIHARGLCMNCYARIWRVTSPEKAKELARRKVDRDRAIRALCRDRRAAVKRQRRIEASRAAEIPPVRYNLDDEPIE